MLRDYLIKQGLSKREVEVAELVSQGLANKKVAEKLFVTEKTIKFHLTNIYRKMKIKSRTQLIVFCMPNYDFVEGAQNSANNNEIPKGNQTVAEINGEFQSSS